jgi:DNA-binding MarR family transcriptional regulator
MDNNAPDPADEDEKRMALAFAQHVLRLQRLLDHSVVTVLAGWGLTRADIDVLGTLHEAGAPYELRPKELSARLLITTGGMSNVIRRLESRGLVSRIPHPGDGRANHVQLTAAGQDVAERSGGSVMDALAGLLSGIRPETLETTLGLLDEVLHTLEPGSVLTSRPAMARRR